MKVSIKRICPGLYEVTKGDRTVSINRADEGSWAGEWVASADWDRCLYTDPVETYREAKFCALRMLDADF